MNNAAAATARTASPVRKLTYSALFLALAMVLPFLIGHIPEIGSMLCPMHLPALLCAGALLLAACGGTRKPVPSRAAVSSAERQFTAPADGSCRRKRAGLRPARG